MLSALYSNYYNTHQQNLGQKNVKPKIDDTHSFESLSFSLSGLVMDHQHAPRNLSLNFSVLTPNNDLNVSELKNFVKSFLANYPNEDDFWEIMNVQLVKSVVLKFPELENVKLTLCLSPDDNLTFFRKSVVEYQKTNGSLLEKFHFIKEKYHICEQSFKDLNLDISWKMKGNPGRFDYPDYQWVNNTVEAFFKDMPISFNSWQTIKPQLLNKILNTYPALESANIKITVVD